MNLSTIINTMKKGLQTNFDRGNTTVSTESDTYLYKNPKGIVHEVPKRMYEDLMANPQFGAEFLGAKPSVTAKPAPIAEVTEEAPAPKAKK